MKKGTVKDLIYFLRGGDFKSIYFLGLFLFGFWLGFFISKQINSIPTTEIVEKVDTIAVKYVDTVRIVLPIETVRVDTVKGYVIGGTWLDTTLVKRNDTLRLTGIDNFVFARWRQKEYINNGSSFLLGVGAFHTVFPPTPNLFLGYQRTYGRFSLWGGLTYNFKNDIGLLAGIGVGI